MATGFWNPFHLCFDAFDRLFAVDNDPDSRPPCRLMHIVPDGDYGYRFRNGRKGVHPFTAWNGELPGTLPMTAGTGEAPSGMLAYESDHAAGRVSGRRCLVTSWGDHRIDRFRLEPHGASFRAIGRAGHHRRRELPARRHRHCARRLAVRERLGRQVVRIARQGTRLAHPCRDATVRPASGRTGEALLYTRIVRCDRRPPAELAATAGRTKGSRMTNSLGNIATGKEDSQCGCVPMRLIGLATRRALHGEIANRVALQDKSPDLRALKRSAWDRSGRRCRNVLDRIPPPKCGPQALAPVD